MGFFKELKKAVTNGLKQGVHEVFDVEYGLKYKNGQVDWFPSGEYENSLKAAKEFQAELDIPAVLVSRLVAKEHREVDLD